MTITPAPATDHEAWQLLERAQAGDVDAFGTIYVLYRVDVYRFINHKIRNHETAEDLTQETFARAWNRVGSVTWQGRSPVAWLITIARNLVFDHCKSAAVRFSTPVAEILDIDGHDASAETEVVTRATRAAVRAAVAGLPPDQRRTVELRYLEEFSVAETAAALGKEEGAVKASAYRAAENLRRALLAERFGSVDQLVGERMQAPVPMPRRAA